MVLDAALLNTQHYKVRIKSKVEQFRKRSSALPYTSALEMGAFGSPSTMVANFFLFTKLCLVLDTSFRLLTVPVVLK